MILKEGQYISDGKRDLLVCKTLRIEDIWYTYLLDEKTEEVAFYRIDINNEMYDFEEIIDNNLIEKLILDFSKEILKENNEG